MQRRLLLLRLPFFFFLIFVSFTPVNSSGVDDPCEPNYLPDPLTLRSDQLTVLISGFSEARIPLLRSLVALYAAHPLVAAVIVLWGNPSTPAAALVPLSDGGETISVIRDPSAPSLNARFLPRAAIRTRAVAVCDDDVGVDAATLSFAFAVWTSRGGGGVGIVGFFARSHEFDLERRGWIYAVHPDRYSIVLTKFMILGTGMLRRYSCWDRLSGARRLVEAERNCEDILMNFVAAMESGEGPVLVDGRVRDWGDPRNSGTAEGNRTVERAGRGEIRRVGLSSRGDHRKKRGDCITEFHRMLGVMPLRYSYGKVVQNVGEQGLCQKNGKLVFCDRF